MFKREGDRAYGSKTSTWLIAGAAMVMLAVTPAGAAQTQSRAAIVDDSFSAEAEALIAAAFPADGPGAAYIVTRGGETLQAGGRGLADVEARRPIRPDSLFRLGSIVKQFTAATVLSLVAEGRISLDDPVSRFFPDWPAAAGARATVRQLLNHTSGIQDFSKIPGWIPANRTRAHSTAELLAVFRDLPAKTEPGAAWEYNNGGYVLLGAIVEQVAGKPWHEVLKERITGPLGLSSIVHEVPAAMSGGAVRGYTDQQGRIVPVEPSSMSVAHAAGGLWGSVGDMARWAKALHRGQVLRPDHYREMTSPARLTDGSTRPYGFGLRLQQLRGRPMLVHGGAGGGLDTDSVYLPQDDLFVAVFANSDDPATDPSLLTRRLAAMTIGQPFPAFQRAQVETEQIEPLFGLYSAEEREPLRFFGRNGRLFVGQGDDQAEVFAAGEDRFFFGPSQLSWLRFLRRPDGAHVVEVHRPDNAEAQTAVRSGDVPAGFSLPAESLRRLIGTYQTEMFAMTIAQNAEGGLTASVPGQPPFAMRPVSETEFRIDGTPMRVVFAREADGSVNRLTLYRGARELHGERVR